jgi:hypothetical protein
LFLAICIYRTIFTYRRKCYFVILGTGLNNPAESTEYFKPYIVYNIDKIAEIEKMSFHDIHAIIKEEQARRQKYKHQQHRQELSSKAYKLFSEGKTSVEVAVILNLREPEVTKLYREYWKLRGLGYTQFNIQRDKCQNMATLENIPTTSKEKGMNIEQIVNVVEIAIHKLPHMEGLYRQAKDEAEKMQYTVQRLANDIEARKHKISTLDSIAFTSEQECKRTKQQVQELTDKKDRIQKTNISIFCSINPDIKS